MLANKVSGDEVIHQIETFPKLISGPSKDPFIGLPEGNRAKRDDHPFLGTKSAHKFEYIDYDKEEERNSLFSESHSGSLENKNRGRYLIGKILEETEQELAKHIKKIEGTEGNALRSVQLMVRSPVRTMLNARIVLNDNTQEINISNFLTSSFCKDRKITAITLLLPGDEKRGIRGRIDENGTKIYEVANGSYQMTLKWYVEEKECNIKISISDDGSVKFIERNGVTKEQLAANNVKVGKQYEAKFLDEALASQIEEKLSHEAPVESSETVEVLSSLQQTSTPQKHKAPDAIGK
ncbi:MAG: hypothetical protein PV340_05505 [Wolbachia sp.]|nr:hypothetical protein [Wolbachia sp.]MDD9336124.1 hypothetical protein [Wolbachia sp.]